jgi:hypothetical protein
MSSASDTADRAGPGDLLAPHSEPKMKEPRRNESAGT